MLLVPQKETILNCSVWIKNVTKNTWFNQKIALSLSIKSLLVWFSCCAEIVGRHLLVITYRKERCRECYGLPKGLIAK